MNANKDLIVGSNMWSPGEVARSIGERAKARRLAMGWRQLDLARATGVALSTLKRFEARGEVGFDVVVRVAMALGVESELTALFPPYEATSLDEVIAKNRRPMRARRRS